MGKSPPPCLALRVHTTVDPHPLADQASAINMISKDLGETLPPGTEKYSGHFSAFPDSLKEAFSNPQAFFLA